MLLTNSHLHEEMLTGVSPGAVGQHIADLVIGDGFAVISGQ